MDTSGIVIAHHSADKRELAYQLRRAMTPAEAVLWKKIGAGRLRGLHFRRQQIIDGFIADFYCHEAGLVVELDGPSHDGQRAYDEERDRILETRNLRILRFRNERVFNDVYAVMHEILEAARVVVLPPDHLPEPAGNGAGGDPDLPTP